jgi:hypothetical protein
MYYSEIKYTLYIYIYLYMCLSCRLDAMYSYNVPSKSVYRSWQLRMYCIFSTGQAGDRGVSQVVWSAET